MRCWLIWLLLLVGPAAAGVPAPPPPDSLRALLRRPTTADTARVRAYRQLAKAMRGQHLDSAQVLAAAGAALAHRLGDQAAAAHAQNGLADIEYLRGNYPAAQRAYEAAIKAARRVPLCRSAANALMGLGLVADAMGNVPGAVAYFEQARVVFGECQPPDPRNELILLTNLGNTYLQAGQLAQAERPLRRALALVQPTTSAPARLNLLDLIGMLQLGQNHPDSAVATWQHELRLARAGKERRSEAYALGNLARVRLQQRQTAAALAYAQEAVRLARAMGNQSQLADFSLIQAHALHAAGRPEAFDSLVRYTVLHDTLVGRARNEAVAQLQVRFDVASHQTQIRVLSQQQRISQLRAAEQASQTRTYALVAGGLLVVVVGGGGLMALLVRSRRQLQTSEASLRVAHQAQQDLMRIIGHDLRGPVATFQQITPLLHHALGPAPDPDATELVGELDGTAQRLGALVDNLLHWARVQGGLVKSDPRPVRAALAVTSAVSLYEPMARYKHVALSSEVAPEVILSTDVDLLMTVLRNLVGNAVKFTPAGGAVTVRVAASAPQLVVGAAGEVVFSVTDSGVGMTPAALASAFGANARPSQRGTAGEAGTGLGLPLCRRFVALLGGELRAEANPGAGMRFWFALPI